MSHKGTRSCPAPPPRVAYSEDRPGGSTNSCCTGYYSTAGHLHELRCSQAEVVDEAEAEVEAEEEEADDEGGYDDFDD